MQVKYAKYVKQMSQIGLPYYYNQDLEANIDAWLADKSKVTTKIYARFKSAEKNLDYALKSYGLPFFIKYIPAANSGINPFFQDANDGAKGIWPIEYSISKKYNLVSNSYQDERLDFEKSSDAACHYLRDLHDIYKDWQKAILAFRIGPVRVNQLMAESGSVNLADFYNKLSAVEKEPINQFYAALVVLKYADSLGLKIEPENKVPVIKTDTASCSLPTTYDIIEKFTGISQETLTSLNPDLLRKTVPALGKVGYFKLPAKSKARYQAQKDTITIYTLYTLYPPNIYDTLITIKDSIEYIDLAKRPFGDFSPGKRIIVAIINTPKDTSMSVPSGPIEIKEPVKIVTKTEPKSVVKPKVEPKPDPVDEPKPPTTEIHKPKMVWVEYTVKKQDGLYTLSDIFDCTIEEVKQWNDMTGNGIFIGQKLKFKVDDAKLKEYKKIESMSTEQKLELAKKD